MNFTQIFTNEQWIQKSQTILNLIQDCEYSDSIEVPIETNKICQLKEWMEIHDWVKKSEAKWDFESIWNVADFLEINCVLDEFSILLIKSFLKKEQVGWILKEMKECDNLKDAAILFHFKYLRQKVPTDIFIDPLQKDCTTILSICCDFGKDCVMGYWKRILEDKDKLIFGKSELLQILEEVCDLDSVIWQHRKEHRTNNFGGVNGSWMYCFCGDSVEEMTQKELILFVDAALLLKWIVKSKKEQRVILYELFEEINFDNQICNKLWKYIKAFVCLYCEDYTKQPNQSLNILQKWSSTFTNQLSNVWHFGNRRRDEHKQEESEIQFTSRIHNSTWKNRAGIPFVANPAFVKEVPISYLCLERVVIREHQEWSWKNAQTVIVKYQLKIDGNQILSDLESPKRLHESLLYQPTRKEVLKQLCKKGTNRSFETSLEQTNTIQDKKSLHLILETSFMCRNYEMILYLFENMDSKSFDIYFWADFWILFVVLYQIEKFNIDDRLIHFVKQNGICVPTHLIRLRLSEIRSLNDFQKDLAASFLLNDNYMKQFIQPEIIEDDFNGFLLDD